MKTLLALPALAIAAAVLPATAHAQTSGEVRPYIGVSGGYHDIGSGGNDDGAIGGIVAGVDVPVGESLTLGVEANYHVGTNVIDSERGVAARLGFPIGGNSQLFVRGGIQTVDFDLAEVAGGPVAPGLDDTDSGYLVGVGGDFALGGSNTRLRVGVDTLSFDTVRATAGIVFGF